MTPVQFFDPMLNSWTIFAWSENSQLHKWKVDSSGALTYLAQGNEFASDNLRGKLPGGCPWGAPARLNLKRAKNFRVWNLFGALGMFSGGGNFHAGQMLIEKRVSSERAAGYGDQKSESRDVTPKPSDLVIAGT